MSSAVEPKAQWYVVHTYSGYENKVKANIEKVVENRGLQSLIHEVKIPVEEQVEFKNGRKKPVIRKKFPGYILVKMVMTDESWHAIRSIRGVTGFVGSQSEPVPLTPEEIRAMKIDEPFTGSSIKEGDNIRVISGPLENFIGIVKEVPPNSEKVKVIISIFGRETPVELRYDQIQKI